MGLASILLCVTIIVPILGIYFSNKGKNSSKANLAKAGKILSTISLSFAAIGLVILICATSVPVITKIITKNEVREVYIPESKDNSLYLSSQEQRELYDWYKSVGMIQTTTDDDPPSTIRVSIFLGYKKGDKATETEITSRLLEIKDYLRRYFRGKTTSELLNMNNEDKMRMEIRNGINDLILSGSKIRDISFDQLEIIEQ